MPNIVLGVTGSVAALKTPDLVRALLAAGHHVKVAATEPSLYFFDKSTLPAGILHRDRDEWTSDRYYRDTPVLHIELRKWANALLIAPLDANTLAKVVLGLADNLLTCVFRAWDVARPVLLAPAMNTLMWEQPVTARHLRRLAEDRGLSPPADNNPDAITAWINEQDAALEIVGPIAKGLACGDVGQGGMAEVPDIVTAVARRFPNSR